MADASQLLTFLDVLPDMVTRIVSSSVFAAHKQRIFADGKAADESKIGDYSTTPGYFDPKEFPKSFPPIGKTGKKGKAAYFEDGYKGARQASGRRTDTVDLRLNGLMEQSFQQSVENGDVVFGFTEKQQAAKAFGNEKRFKKSIFEVSKKEMEIIPKVLEEEL